MQPQKGVLLTLFFLLVFAVAIGIFVFKLIRFVVQRKKGRLTISLAPQPLDFGRPVNGVITLNAKRSLGPGHLAIELLCTERDHDENRETVLYRDRVELHRSLSVSGSEPLSMPFTMMIPTSDHPGVRQGYDFQSWTRWKVVGTYRIDGVDLEGSTGLSLPNPR